MIRGPTALARVTQPQRVYSTLSRLAAARVPGARMPAYAELRRRLGATQRSLDLAYERLAAEGIIEVRARRGVYVCDPWANACFVYILTSLQFLPGMSDQVRQYYLNLRAEIARQMPGAELELLMIDYSGKDKLREQRLRHHLGMFRDRLRLLGCFAAVQFKTPETRTFLQETALPLIDVDNPHNPGATIGTTGSDERLRQAWEHLRGEGWERIAVVDVTYGDAGTKYFPQSARRSREMVARVCPSACLHHLEVPLSERIDDRAAALIHRLIANDDLPEAFIVLDDHVCRGMLRGALEAGLRLEETCALLTVSNEGVPIHASRELTRIEMQLPAVATASCQLMRRLLRGDAGTPPHVPMQFIVGKTSRRTDYPQRTQYATAVAEEY